MRVSAVFSVCCVLSAVCFLSVWPELVMACPNCKELLFDPGQVTQKLSTARGYALSIGLMLAVPLGLVSGTTALIIRAQRRKRRGELRGQGTE